MQFYYFSLLLTWQSQQKNMRHLRNTENMTLNHLFYKVTLNLLLNVVSREKLNWVKSLSWQQPLWWQQKQTLWNTLQLQVKNSFFYRNPSLLGCLLTIHQGQWKPRFRKPQHRIISICLLPDFQFYAPFETLLSLSAHWSFYPAARLPSSDPVKKLNLLDCEHLLSRAVVASYRPLTTLKRGLVCCYHAEGLLQPLLN